MALAKTAEELAAMMLECVKQKPGCAGVTMVRVSSRGEGVVRWSVDSYNPGDADAGPAAIENAILDCWEVLHASFECAD